MAMASAQKTLFDLPVEDIMVDHVVKYLYFEDLLEFRECSRKCRDIADKMLYGMDRLFIYNYHDPQLGYPFVFDIVSHLKIISLGGLDWLQDNMLVKLLKNSPLLEIFYINNCTAITPRGIIPLATHCKNLRHLMLDNVPVGDNFLHTFALHNRKLETLSLSANKDITSRRLQTFLAKQPLLRNITLDEFKVLRSRNSDPSSVLKPGSMRHIFNTIAKECHNVEYLSFNNCYDVDDDTVIKLANQLPKIKAIHIELPRDNDDREDQEFTQKSFNHLIDCGISHEKTDDVQKMEDLLEEPKKAYHKGFLHRCVADLFAHKM